MKNQSTHDLWQRLKNIRSYSFNARNDVGSKTDWSGEGSGEVIIEFRESEITYIEKGVYRTPQGKMLNTQNRYRWALENDEIKVSQLQRGEWVYLLSLECECESEWKTRKPHLCVADEYTLYLKAQDDCLIANWQITGPRKNEQIVYRYL